MRRLVLPPTDIDLQLTEQLRRLEQSLADAVPQVGVPRAVWMENSLHRYNVESVELKDCTARKLTDDLAVVSLLLTQRASVDNRDRNGDFYVVDIWRKRGNGWQVIARYPSPLGKTFDRMRPR